METIPALDSELFHSHDSSARCRIMQAAVDAFGRRGYAATSVREIVEHAGVTKPVLYYHFGSKEGLMKAIMEEAAKAVSAVVERARLESGTARHQVLRLCESLQELVRAHTSELRVVHAVYYFAPELLPTFDFRVFERLILGELERIIDAGIQSGELRPVPTKRAAVLVASVLGAFLDQELSHVEVARSEVDIAPVLDLTFDGLCPSPTA
jgi:TetR/AcrR family transcriptional regulator